MQGGSGSGWAPASADTGPARFPRLLLPTPSRRLPKHGTPGASPHFEEGNRLSGLASLAACPSRSLVRAEPVAVPCSRLALLRCAPPGHGAATRDGVRPRAPPAPAPAPYVEDVQGDAGPGGDIAASPSPFPEQEGVAARPPLWPGPHLLALRRHAAANGHRGGGTAGGCQPPRARERGNGERASRRAPGRGGGAAGLGEEPPSNSPRTTARQGCGGLTLVPRLTPRAPDRQHDRRAAPGLLLHRAEG